MSETHCKVRTKGPSKVEYTRQKIRSRLAFRRIGGLFKRTRSTRDEPLPPPHEWPPYLGPCYIQANEEALALALVAETRRAYETFMAGSYRPPWALQYYLTAYENAKAAYLAAWDAMEGCVNPIV
jgi:hypothetical protein